MIRQHQFQKVELVSVTEPDKSNDEHERMLSCAELVLKKLDIPFRVMILSHFSITNMVTLVRKLILY